MDLSFITLDVFTTDRYAGNPLAVVSVPSSISPRLTQSQKQSIAKEFNLSETVFLHLDEDPNAPSTKIDIFTTHAEIPFAGHPTIGSAYLLTSGNEKATSIQTKAGLIPISLGKKAGIVRAEIPHDVHVHALTFSSEWTKEPAPVVSIVKGVTFILAQLDTLSTLGKTKESIYKDFLNTTGLDPDWQSGILVSYFYVLLGSDESGTQIRTRMFGLGIEDPATGSAATALCSYLSMLEGKAKGAGPFSYNIVQGVEMGRESHIGVEVTRTADGTEISKVVLSGTAVPVMKGHITI